MTRPRRLRSIHTTHFLMLCCTWALVGGIPASDAADPTTEATEIVGTPEALGLGITETVDQIMERERTSPASGRTRMEDAEGKREHGRPVKPVENPLAPGVSQWPPAAEGTTRTAQVLAPQTIGTSFRATGTSTGDSLFIPPDSMGDVGTSQILVHVNGRVKVFGKTGVLGALNVTDSSFWASVNAGLDQTDPEVRYDRLSGRWFLMTVNLAASNNRVMIAVSSGATIAGAASFTFFQFPLSAGGGTGDTTNFCDFPSFGVDANAVYIGCNMFDGTTGGFVQTTGFVVRKASITGAGPIVVTAFRGLANASTAGPYSPRGVDNDDPAATQGYFIGVDILTFSRLQIRRISTPGATPTISANLTLNVPTTGFPILQPASGSTTAISAGDDRLLMASIHKNKITGVATLRTAHAFEVNASCVAAAGGGRNGSRWYEIGSLTGTPALVQSGTLCDPAASNPKGYFYPSVVGTGQGHMVLAASFAAANQFAGAAAAGRLRTDAAGATQAPVIAQTGLAAYTILADGQNRWGDFTFSDVDPLDDQTVWTIQEYADTPANNWAIRAIQLKAPPPATPSTAIPSSVCTGVAAVNVAITGTSAAGAEFFDPGPDAGGPGYASHILASVIGGVAVTATTFVDPTHVTLSLDTTGAIAGAWDVTVTNPDGQSAIGPSLLSVVAAPSTVDNGVRVNRSGASAQILWNPASGATSSDVVRGLLSALPVGPGGGDESCLANNAAGSSLLDGTNPNLGDGFWYLIRGEGACGKGPYGFEGTNGVPAAPRVTTTCS